MMKRLAFIAFLSVIMLNGIVLGKPQDVPEAAILAFAQMKDTIDNGAVASDKKEFEIFGAQFKNDMQIGFGDAMRLKRSNRLPMSELSSPLSHPSYMERVERSVKFSELSSEIVNSKETVRTKRANDNSVIDSEYSDEDSDYSISSSSESEENERRKRSITYEEFINMFSLN